MDKKKIGIYTGNISIGGQEKMMIEFLKVLSPEKYDIKLFIEENKGENNVYESEIPSYVDYKFLTTAEFIKKTEDLRKNKNPIKKVIYSMLLMRKKKIAINEMKKGCKDREIIIDYNMGMLRHLHRLDLRDKKLIGWSHAGEGIVLKKKQKELNLALYDYIVTLNDVMKNGYETKHNFTKTKIVKIENFVDRDEIIRKGEENIPESLGEYILSVGSLTENKNHEEIIKGFKRYKDRIKDNLKLVIIGEGREREYLENLIDRLKLKDSVLLLGNRSNPYPYMKNCKVYIQGSKAEAFALVIAEAMVFGKPIIAKNNVGINLVTDNGKYGVVVDNLELELDRKLEKILSKEYQKYSELSFFRGNEFTAERAKIKIEELIDNI